MQNLIDIFTERSLLWGLIVLLLIAAIYGARALFAARIIAQDAREDYAYKQPQGMIPNGISEATYIRAYQRFNAPRASRYMAATLGAIGVLTLPALGILNFITVKVWEWGGKDEVFAPGFLVHSLLMFFLIIFFWAATAYVAARHYHKHTPTTLDAMLSAEAGKTF